MIEPSRDVDLDREHDFAGEEGAYVGRPRWVKWFMAIAALLVALYFVLLILAGGAGDHPPERH